MNELEQRLSRELSAVSARYRDALRIVDPLATASLDPLDRDRRVDQVQSLMQKIALLESQMRPLRSEWTTLGRRPGPELRRVLDVQQELISALLGQVQTCEHRLAAERSRLLPAINVEVRRRDMQRAYARHR